jgi:hypothetical protein
MTFPTPSPPISSTMLLATMLLATMLGCARSNDAEPALTSAEPAAGHRHDGWWCDEHGVPEEECGRCDAKLAAWFQKRGDWCKEHDRPDSQCFTCHPELEAAFAARYEARTGRQPPKPSG